MTMAPKSNVSHVIPPIIPRNSLILVGDGQKALFLRNTGSAQRIDLVVERILEQENPATREKGTARTVYCKCWCCPKRDGRSRLAPHCKGTIRKRDCQSTLSPCSRQSLRQPHHHCSPEDTGQTSQGVSPGGPRTDRR